MGPADTGGSRIVSAGYFEHAGFARLPVNHEPGAAYPHQFWMALPDSR